MAEASKSKSMNLKQLNNKTKGYCLIFLSNGSTFWGPPVFRGKTTFTITDQKLNLSFT